MKKLVVLLLLLSAFVTVHAEYEGEMTQEVYEAYRTLMGSESYTYRKQTAINLYDIYEDTGNDIIVGIVIDLLDNRYSYVDFDEGDDTMFYDDIVAEALVGILINAQDPEAFDILSTIVIERNHRDATINKAWEAIQNIDWPKEETEEEPIE